MKDLTDTECAYLAGIIEGEGCIRIDRVRTKKGATYTGWRPTVHVTQKGNELIQSLNNIFPGQIITCHSSDSRHVDNRRIAWNWGKAYTLLEKILPYMRGPKRKQADVVLRFHTHIQNLDKQSYLSNEELEWREIQLNLLGYLKRETA
jgi:hypothetical protein